MSRLLLLLLLLMPIYTSAEPAPNQAPTATELLEARSKALAAAIETAKKQLEQRRKRLGDLQAAVHLLAEDSQKQLSGSLIAVQHPRTGALLQALKEPGKTVDLAAVEQLAERLLAEMRAQARVDRFKTPLIATDGSQSEAEVVRVGPFVALHEGRYLEFVAELGRFRVLERQPAARFLQANQTGKEGADPGTVAIDPSRGSLLALLIQVPGLEERLHQGGLVGYIIMVLALIGALLALLRILMLRVTAGRVRRQRRNPDQPKPNNPLGRVLLAVQEQSGEEIELIERRLDEAILKEMPRLEWGLPLIRLLAAIAPLLGLLGTVVGMILTFQAISLFGSGDPKLMAGGISQALVTTVLGLMAAIPLLLLHSIAMGSSRKVEQVLEEQAAAIVARRLEAESSA